MNIKKMICSLCLVIAVTANLCGCSLSSTSEPLTLTGFAFDTVYTLTLYHGGSQELLDSCVSQCDRFEEIFSRTREDSELYAINEIERLYAQIWQEETGKKDITEQWNHAGEKGLSPEKTARWEKKLQEKIRAEGLAEKQCTIGEDGSIQIAVSEEMAELVKKGLEYSRLSKGGFDITIYPVSILWDFRLENPKIPEKNQLKRAVGYVDYQKVSVDGETITFSMPGMGIDLGGIAKGYIADRLKEYLTENGVASGMVSLGGNVLCIGRKSKKEQFRVGIQQPFADRNETIAVINAEDVSVVSSGVYERFIQDGNTMYHHILNPKTGYSYDNGLVGVTIVSEESVDGDGISTSAFALGLEEGMKLIDSLEGVEAVFITEDEKMHYTDGFREMLEEQDS